MAVLSNSSASRALPPRAPLCMRMPLLACCSAMLPLLLLAAACGSASAGYVTDPDRASVSVGCVTHLSGPVVSVSDVVYNRYTAYPAAGCSYYVGQYTITYTASSAIVRLQSTGCIDQVLAVVLRREAVGNYRIRGVDIGAYSDSTLVYMRYTVTSNPQSPAYNPILTNVSPNPLEASATIGSVTHDSGPNQAPGGGGKNDYYIVRHASGCVYDKSRYTVTTTFNSATVRLESTNCADQVVNFVVKPSAKGITRLYATYIFFYGDAVHLVPAFL